MTRNDITCIIMAGIMLGLTFAAPFVILGLGLVR